jgi:class 3 adenylate cyclase
MKENQVPDKYKKVLDEQLNIFKQSIKTTEFNNIPETSKIPIENPLHWIKLRDVVCVFVDMKGSTLVSAKTNEANIASIYQLFTGTAVKLFDALESPYIDIKGDGVFALFDSDKINQALCSAITFKTFCTEDIIPKIKEKYKIEVGTHIGIHIDDLLVRKIGFKRFKDRSDRQNEVWAGRTVNMSAKLAQLSEVNEVIVSENFYSRIINEKALFSCGCPGGEKKKLWSELDVAADERFDFERAFKLSSNWCAIHGKDYIESILNP